MKIFVGGLPKDITDADLLEAFGEFGEVTEAKIVTDKKTGISRSYGFVEMPNIEQARRAIETLHEAVVDGQTVSVKEGVEKPKSKPDPLKTRNQDTGFARRYPGAGNRNNTGVKPAGYVKRSPSAGKRPRYKPE